MVLEFKILEVLFLGVSLFGPDRAEGIAVGAALIVVGGFVVLDEEFRVKGIEITLLFIILNNFVQITLQPEELES